MSAQTIRTLRSSSVFSGIQRSFASVNNEEKSRSLPWMASALCSTALTTTTTTSIALCDSDEDFITKIKSKIESSYLSDISKSDSMEVLLSTVGASAQSVFDSGIPTNLSYGFFAGYVSGLALKKIGRVASVSLGLGFLGLQALAYQGYIVVDHAKIAGEVERILDRNKDGRVDVEDLRGVIEDVRRVAEHGLGSVEGGLAVSGGGFGLGFYGGLRSG